MRRGEWSEEERKEGRGGGMEEKRDRHKKSSNHSRFQYLEKLLAMFWRANTIFQHKHTHTFLLSYKHKVSPLYIKIPT